MRSEKRGPVSASASTPGYRQADLPIEERVHDLLGRMTLLEKLAQLGGVWGLSVSDAAGFSEAKAKQVLRHGTGHITRLAGATVLKPHESAALANQIQRFLLEHTRLGIPAIVHEESCAGYSARDATCFPQAIGLASTWEPELVEEMAGVIRRQMRAVGAHQSLAPVLDIARDPRWGRSEETFGEDPYLVARMGAAYVRGLQGETLRDASWPPASTSWAMALRRVASTGHRRRSREGSFANASCLPSRWPYGRQGFVPS